MSRRVWVIMGNDFPDAVCPSQDSADAFIAARKAAAEKLPNGDPSKRIYWRYYEFEVEHGQ